MASFLKQTFELLNGMVATRATPQPAPPRRTAANQPPTRSQTTGNNCNQQRAASRQQQTNHRSPGEAPEPRNAPAAAGRRCTPNCAPTPNAQNQDNIHYNYRLPYHYNRQQQQQQQAHSQTTGSPKAPAPSSQPEGAAMELKELEDLCDIDKLTVKQLKALLVKNCVDFKGVIEVEELRAKVRILWLDYNGRREARRARKAKGSGSFDSEIDDKRMCKICMEKEIDSVLLECGHMLSCVNCGKKLTDCPICRQPVSRCLRTFQV